MWQDVTYDNVKSHKKARFYPLSRKRIVGKTTRRGVQFDPPPSLFRVKEDIARAKNFLELYKLLMIFVHLMVEENFKIHTKTYILSKELVLNV